MAKFAKLRVGLAQINPTVGALRENAAKILDYYNQAADAGCDVILMDINLPDVSGIDLCKQVLEKYPTIRIIALSSYKQLSFINKMLDNGALGYALKNATKQEILTAIATVKQGKQYLSLEASEMVKNSKADDMPILTRREKEVLELIANGLTNAEMAAQLSVSPTTIDTHRKHLLEKFDAKNTAILIKKAIGMNFV